MEVARPISDYLDDDAIQRLHEQLAARGWPCRPVEVTGADGTTKTDRLGRYGTTLRLMPDAMPDGFKTWRVRANDGLCVPVVAFEVSAWSLREGGHAPFARLASTAHRSEASGPARSKATATLMGNVKKALDRKAPQTFRRDPDEHNMSFGVPFATVRLPDGGAAETVDAAADCIAAWCEVAVPWFNENWSTIANRIPLEERC